MAKREILAICIDREKKQVDEVVDMLKDIIKIFKSEESQLSNFTSAMKVLAGKKSESEANLIPADDVTMIKVHKILHNHNLVGHLPTYQQVFSALEQLRDKKIHLEKQLHLKKLNQIDDVQAATNKLNGLFDVLEMGENGKQVSLSPSCLRSGLSQLEKVMRDIKLQASKVWAR